MAVLTEAEFNDLFKKLQINVPQRKREQIFACVELSGSWVGSQSGERLGTLTVVVLVPCFCFSFCDADGSGTISQEEFVDSWDWVEQQMVLEAAEEAGLDDSAIIVAVVTLVVLLLCVFAFIFVAIRAWNNEGSFDAVIQSFLVVASGKVTSLAKKKPVRTHPKLACTAMLSRLPGAHTHLKADCNGCCQRHISSRTSEISRGAGRPRERRC